MHGTDLTPQTVTGSSEQEKEEYNSTENSKFPDVVKCNDNTCKDVIVVVMCKWC